MGGNVGSVSTGCRDGGSYRWAVALLSNQGMPPEEIVTLLDAEDPRVVHRLLDLHRERLAERLTGERRIVELIELLLTAAAGRALVGGGG